ncbi:MAG: hypothetical protein KF893_01535 [Caldilineaceae bacterium]|nr:hypothetical protein [Caldilineaceae bacterium]
MFKQHQRLTSSLHSVLMAILIAVMMLSVTPPALLAQEVEPTATDGRINDNILEFGVWWVEDYPPAGPGGADLPATRPDALGLRDKLTSTCKVSFLGICWSNWSTPTWTPRFIFGNSNAWASDWRPPSDNIYIDSVDLAYFAGHGSKSGIYFGAGSPTPTLVSKTQVVNAWGDRDLDWIGLAACNVLDDPISNLQDWGNAMNGVRLIMGFKTVMNDVPHGREFGHYIREGYTFTQAWFKAADKLQSQNRVARVLAEQQAYFDDRPAQHNAVTVVNWPKYFRTHTVGSEPARFVDATQLNGEMPVLKVQPLDLAEVSGRINTLESAFGVTITIPTTGTQSAGIQAVLDNGGIFYSEDGKLEMDGVYGLFLHTDTDNLWMTESARSLQAAAGVAMQAISEDEAQRIADGFLTDNGLKPGDAQFYEVVADTLSTMDITTDPSGVSAAAIVAEKTTNFQVIFSRIITYELSLDGRQTTDPIEFSVMGPGSRLKVYVDTQVPAGLSGAALYNESVLGAQGGFRRIQLPVEAAATGALQMVQMLPEATVKKLFDHLESTVALDHIPLEPSEIVSRSIRSITPAYWEGPIGFEQGELIPVYAFELDNYMKDEVDSTYLVTSTTYIPVNPEYMAPLARISSTVDLDENATPGQTIVLEALDASKTLEELGLDPSPNDGSPLNFNLGTEGGVFLYDWYINEVSAETKLTPKDGTGGRILEYTIDLGLGVDAKDSSMGTQRILLVVTDTGKSSEPNSSQAVLTLNATPPIYLPAVQSQ